MESLQFNDAATILKRRAELGKGPLDFIWIFCCDVGKDPQFVSEWLTLTRCLLVYKQWTFDPDTKKANLPKIYLGPKRIGGGARSKPGGG